jgi:hypothetical protein
MIKTPLRGLKDRHDPPIQGLLLGFLAIAIALGVSSAADNLIDQVVVLWYVFAIAGAANWAAREARKPDLERTPSPLPVATSSV